MEAVNRIGKWSVLRGIVAILFGTLALARPGLTMGALVLLFGAYAVADGFMMIAWGIVNGQGGARWALILSGILGIAAGVITFVMPGITAFSLLMVIAAWAIVAGISMMVLAFRLRKEITGEWRLVLAGLLSVAFGVILFASPGAGALAMVMWIGIDAIFTGVLMLLAGIRIRGWGQQMDHGKLAAHPG
jgi:uncharacterized membrane protein HdeD (DUF308 family)